MILKLTIYFNEIFIAISDDNSVHYITCPDKITYSVNCLARFADYPHPVSIDVGLLFLLNF
jgi:hypothetical protein